MKKYKCEFCGLEFDELPSKCASGRFCSKKCARTFGSDGDREKTKDCTCIECGTVFQVKKE